MPGRFRTVWNVSGQTGQFPDRLESFRTVWKISGQSGKNFRFMCLYIFNIHTFVFHVSSGCFKCIPKLFTKDCVILLAAFTFCHLCVIKCLLKGLPEKMHSDINCICLAFLHCRFSNDSSNCLHQQMNSHIGCIYLTFLRCAFLNVSSKRLHKWLHSHIGRICLTFLHCAFSNVSSNCLPEKMQSHIDCICLIFLCCLFSNVSSNCLPEKMHRGRVQKKT